MIRVLIADDHPIVRRGLRQIVADQSDMSVAEAENGPDVLQEIESNVFDVIVLDINMPGRSGLEVLGELRRRDPNLPVLILSGLPESDVAVRMLKAGAAGYLNKDLAPEELVNAIRRVASGRKYVSEAVAELLALSVSNANVLPHETLSDREYQVLMMIARGKTVSEIADEMALSVKTISTYRSRILEKMSMRNNADLMHYAITRGLRQGGPESL